MTKPIVTYGCYTFQSCTQQYAKLRPGTITHRDAVGIASRIISFRDRSLVVIANLNIGMGAHIDGNGCIIIVGKGIANSSQFTLRFHGRHEFYAINCGTVQAIQFLGIIVVHLQSNSISAI